MHCNLKQKSGVINDAVFTKMVGFVADCKIYNICVPALTKKRLEDVFKVKEVGSVVFYRIYCWLGYLFVRKLSELMNVACYRSRQISRPSPSYIMLFELD
jgi:hypothetical protein